MADVIGTISACVHFAATGLQIAKAVRERVHWSTTVKTELARIEKVLDTYHNLLAGLQQEAEAERAQNGDAQTQSPLAALCVSEGPLASSKEAMMALQKRLIKVKGSFTTGKIIDRRASAAMACLEQALPILQLAMHADQRKLTQEVDDKIGLLRRLLSNLESESKDIQHATARMLLAMSDLQVAAEEDVRMKLSDTISSRDLRESLQSNLSFVEDHASPCSWFFDSASWAHWQRNPGILWVHGGSGTRKTILLSLAISKLYRNAARSSKPSIIAYFFFNFRETLMQDTKSMMRGLTRQLAQQCSLDNMKRIVQDYFSKYAAVDPNNYKAALQRAIDYVSDDNDVFIVVDGLDEAAELYKTSKVLFDLQSCHILVSSQEIRLRGPRQTGVALEMRLVSMDQNAIQQEIEEYVKSHLNKESGLSRLSDQRKGIVLNGIMSRCSGMFRLAQCQLDHIRSLKEQRPVTLREAVQNLPDELSGIYQKHIDCFSSDKERSLALSLLALLYRFGSVQSLELAEYLAFASSSRQPSEDEVFEEADIANLGGTLVRIAHTARAGSRVVSLAHQTVATFVRKNYYDAKAEEDIRSRCTAYFHLPLRWDDLRRVLREEVGSSRATNSRRPISRSNRYLQKYLDCTFPLHGLCSRTLREAQKQRDKPLKLQLQDQDLPLWYLCNLAAYTGCGTVEDCLQFALAFLPTASPRQLRMWSAGIYVQSEWLVETAVAGCAASPQVGGRHSIDAAKFDLRAWEPSYNLQRVFGGVWREQVISTRSYAYFITLIEVLCLKSSGVQISCQGMPIPELRAKAMALSRTGRFRRSELRLDILWDKVKTDLKRCFRAGEDKETELEECAVICAIFDIQRTPKRPERMHNVNEQTWAYNRSATDVRRHEHNERAPKREACSGYC